jgi:peptidyl-prolyl cis-trans isomerase A (cyclophilin A)
MTAKPTLTRTALLASLTALAACGGGGGDAAPPPSPVPPPVACTSSPPPAPPVTVSAEPQVTFAVTNGFGVAGTVVLTLNRTAAPVTVANFLQYVNSGFYNCTVFHRFVPGFVLQGGGFASPMNVSATALNSPKPTSPAIVLEDNNGLSNVRWTIAMARTGLPDSATAQFFINVADNSTILDRTPARRGYAVFGTVTAGTEVITAAGAAPNCAPWGSLFGDTSCLPTPNLTITAASQTR